ncbi:STAS domain-containing protein [Thiorhodococcus fuscus]|uniref:Anti-sigma factor antagonist n=1 Tax=Thiorhodococcus fuscus TaxID=527200 RepID=A0ABW4YCI5_9GAMM
MDIQISHEQQASIVAVSGKLDTLTAPAYEKAVTELIDSGTTQMVIDFSELSYISSAGLRSLLVTAKMLKSKSGKLALANVTGGVRDVFEMAGFGSIFAMYDSIPAALEGL